MGSKPCDSNAVVQVEALLPAPRGAGAGPVAFSVAALVTGTSGSRITSCRPIQVPSTMGRDGIDGVSLFPLADAMIAATAQAERAELKTLNVKHYPMIKGLKPAYRKP